MLTITSSTGEREPRLRKQLRRMIERYGVNAVLREFTEVASEWEARCTNEWQDFHSAAEWGNLADALDALGISEGDDE
jgi:hypothetical protein